MTNFDSYLNPLFWLRWVIQFGPLAAGALAAVWALRGLPPGLQLRWYRGWLTRVFAVASIAYLAVGLLIISGVRPVEDWNRRFDKLGEVGMVRSMTPPLLPAHAAGSWP
jgi:hypothetical protein